MVEIPRCNCGSRDSGLVCFRGRWWCARCIESALDASEKREAELLKTVALLKHRLASVTCPVPNLAEYERLRQEVEQLRAENEQPKVTLGDSLVLPLLSADQIAEIEAAEAAKET